MNKTIGYSSIVEREMVIPPPICLLLSLPNLNDLSPLIPFKYHPLIKAELETRRIKEEVNRRTTS